MKNKCAVAPGWDSALTAAQLRKQIHQRLETLPDDRLRAALHFVEYLNQTADDATLELLAIPGLEPALLRAKRQADKGQVVPLAKVRRDV
jgi:hypothetical protein